MSLINREELLKDLIKRLHAGDAFDEVRAEFVKEFEGVSAQEIADVEKSLVEQGEVSVAEIQKLCDVHATLFEGSIDAIHGDKRRDSNIGHPVWVLKEENRAIERLFSERIDKHAAALKEGQSEAVSALEKDLEDLWQIDRHYGRKENLWFPIMERYGITAPPQVMWGVDDEIREAIKTARSNLSFEKRTQFLELLALAKEKIVAMISKEEDILIPMVSEVFFATDWRHISEESAEVGFCLMDNHSEWTPPKLEEAKVDGKLMEQGVVKLPSGSFTPEMLSRVLNALPIDITVVDANDEVLYFSQSSERIFPRTTAIIGRKVANCHPPASVHIVEKILNEFKDGSRDSAEFYIHLGDKYIFIRYWPIRDEEGNYLGTLEVSQDIAPLQKLKGDKRLLDEA
ncbi:MAG: DUF438 domain-containing protein [Sphaerochaetaceae bacterium]